MDFCTIVTEYKRFFFGLGWVWRMGATMYYEVESGYQLVSNFFFRGEHHCMFSYYCRFNVVL